MRRRRLFFVAVLTFSLNLWVSWRLLTCAYIDQLGSIEGTHIALGRWILENWRDLSWFPLWYGGIPWQNTYPPLHPMFVAVLSAVTGVSPALSYHALTAIFYSLGPVTLLLLAARLSGSILAGGASALLYSLFSPASFLLPVVRHDAGGFWHARRLQALVQYGEGPHIAAMALLPLAVLLLDVACERRRPGWWLLASLALATVPLTNWLGASALVFAIAAWMLTDSRCGAWRRWLGASAIGALAYVISSPLIPPSAVLHIQSQERYVSGELSQQRSAAAGAGAIILVLALWAFRRLQVPRHLRFALLFLLPMAAVPLLSYAAGIDLLPQAARYHLEMEMAIALLAGGVAAWALARLSFWARAATAGVALVLCIYSITQYRHHARGLIHPVDITQTVEFREAHWLRRNLYPCRVLAPGSVGFFLNVFTDMPQLGGGFDQGVINPVHPHAYYQILSGENGEVAVLWLKVFGVDAVGVSGQASKEYYKPFRNPRKFEGLLPVLWREGDDVIYGVPRRSRSLAHVIRRRDLPGRTPEHGLDVAPVRSYVAALENPTFPIAELAWHNRHSAFISASMRKDQILSVQISYHPGWSATANGRAARVYGDRLGQLVVEPDCDGPCAVRLRYDGGLERYLTVALSILALAGSVLWILLDWKKRRLFQDRSTAPANTASRGTRRSGSR